MSAPRIVTKERARKRPSDPTEAMGLRVGRLAAANARADEALNQPLANETWDALEIAVACLCEGKAQTLLGAMAQLVCLGEIGDYLEDAASEMVDPRDRILAARFARRLDRVLYSVRAVLEAETGIDADAAFGGDTLMPRGFDPHAIGLEDAA